MYTFNVEVNLFPFKELSEESKRLAIDNHHSFMKSIGTTVEDEDGEIKTVYPDYFEEDIIDNIEVNSYLFYENGKLAHTVRDVTLNSFKMVYISDNGCHYDIEINKIK